MEAAECWLNILTRAWENKDIKSLARILSDTCKYLEDVPDSKKEVFMHIVLDEKLCDKPVKELFDAIQFFIKCFGSHCDPFAMQIRNICFNCLKTCPSLDIKKSAAETLVILIKLCKNPNLKLGEIVEHYKDDKMFYIVIGTIAKYCPKHEKIINLSNSIFLNLLYALQQQTQFSNRKRNPESIRIYIQCLSNMMENFFPFEEDKEVTYLKRIYSYCSELCEFTTSEEILEVILTYIIKHHQHFSSFIFKNYKKWHLLLNSLNKDYPSNVSENNIRLFYKFMPQLILKENNKNVFEENNKNVFEYFKTFFITNLKNGNIKPVMLSLTIYGLGYISPVYFKYKPDELNIIFQEIHHQASIILSKTNADTDIGITSDILQSLSEIINQLPVVTFYHINSLIQLSILEFNIFPKVNTADQIRIVDTLTVIFGNVQKWEKTFQKQYFQSFFHQAILTSCSHPLSVDIQLEQEVQYFSEHLICHKNYLPFWQAIFKKKYQKEFEQEIFSDVILILTSFINRINFEIKIYDNKFSTDTTLRLKTENDIDFRYFINLVDLFEKIMEEIDVVLLQNHVEKLLAYFIKYSYKNPLISGFYKFSNAILKKIHNEHDFKNCMNKYTNELITQYLTDILKSIGEFSDELQLSCIYLIFNSPLQIIKNIFSETMPVFKVAFRIGISDFSLALRAIEVLELWTNTLKNQHVNDFREDVVIYLEPYLLIEHRPTAEDEQLKTLQRTILRFYGTIDVEAMRSFIMDKSCTLNQKENFLTLEQCFTETDLKINFYKLIQRIITIINSEDRSTKFVAVELLQNIFSYILGKKLIEQYVDEHLCIDLLKFTSNPDVSIRNIFCHLIMKLIQYLSTKTFLKINATEHFINALFKGLSDDTNSLLRDYCGIYIRCFVFGMIKQSSDVDISKSTIFISILKRIIDFALYPDNSKRVAAAIAFNNLYEVLKSFPSIINIYWLEFFYGFVKSLEGCNDMQIVTAVSNVENVTKLKANMLNAKSPQRRKPSEFSTETLEGALKWLFQQCGSVKPQFRNKCVTLFENLCLLVNKFQSVTIFLNLYGTNYISSLCTRELKENCPDVTIANTKVFLESLNYYIWIFDKKFILPENCFIVDSDKEETRAFFKFLNEFVSLIIEQKTEEIISASTSTFTETQELTDLLNLVIWSIFKFVLKVLLTNKSDTIHVLKKFWSNNLLSLIYQFTLYPRKIGITSKTLLVIEPKELKNLFIILQQTLPNPDLLEMQENFFSAHKEDLQRFVSIDDFLNGKNDVLYFKDFVRGLKILRKSRFFKGTELEIFTKEFFIKIIKEISEALENIEENHELHDARKIIAVKDYFVDVVEFLLLDYKNELVKFLLDFVKTRAPNSSANKTALQGRYLFYETFKTPILRCMLKEPSKTLDLLLVVLEDSPEEIYLLYDIVKYADGRSSDESTHLASEIMQRFDEFKALVPNDVKHNDLFLNICRIAVVPMDSDSTDEEMLPEPPDGLFGWIRQELLEASDLERKSYLLESLLPFISANNDLYSVLDGLREEDVSTWTNRLLSNVVERTQAVFCLQVLFKQLAVCKSLSMFEGIITYAAGACKLLLTKQQSREHLKNYFAAVPECDATIAVDTIYRIFMYETLSAEKRLDVLDYFLIPSLECCSTGSFLTFFRNYAQDLSALMELQHSESADELRQTIIAAIGGYQMFELLFGRTSASDSLVLRNNEAPSSFLTRHALNVRSALHEFANSERELVRLLQCAALNGLVAVACARDDGPLCHSLLAEEAQQPLWRRIVDCHRVYSLASRPKKLSERTINVIKSIDDGVVEYHLSPIDPARIGSDEWRMEVDPRKSLALEEDELNEHECAAALTGLVVCFHERRASDESLPWLESFRKAFDKEKDNVNLLLMRVMTNAREAFLPYLAYLFDDLLFAVRLYLSRNTLNYLVRDVLSMLVESKYQLSSEADVEAVQDLLELLMLRTSAPGSENHEDNVELIESFVILWKRSLIIPLNFNLVLRANPAFALRLFLILIKNLEADTCKKLIEIRSIHVLVRKAMFRWKEPGTDRTYETLGWIMRYIEDHQRDVLIKEDLVSLFVDMQRCNKNLCARYAYLTFLGCPSLAHRKELWPFVDPKLVDDVERKAECFEIFFHTMSALSYGAILLRLGESGLKDLLRNRVVPCISIGLKIIKSLLTKTVFTKELLSYVEILVLYTSKDVILEYKSVAYEIFTDMFLKYTHSDYIGDENAEKLVKICQRILINGIFDWNSEIQSKLLDIWRDKLRHQKSPNDRLVHLLQMYETELHSSFAQFFCLLVLDLVKTSRVVENSPQKNNEECEIDTVPNLRTTRSSIPTFASSLTGLVEQTMINNLCNDGELSTEANWTLIQMLSPKPKPKKKESNFSRILQKKCSSTYDFFLKLKEEKEGAKNNVKIRQKYKVNNQPLPDIALLNIIATLENLVRRDSFTADVIAVSLVYSILKNLLYSVQYDDIIDVVAKTCCLALKQPNDFAPTAMEILFKCDCNKFDANDVMKIANSMGLQPLGILLLEKNSFNLQTKSSHFHPLYNNSLPLVCMYQTIGDRDMVKTIFQNWTTNDWITNTNLRQGFLVELEHNWISAKTFYEEAFENQEECDESVKDYCLNGIFQCLTELSSWTEIEKKVDGILNKNYDSVWQDSRKKDLLPWIFLAQSQKTLEDLSSGKSSDDNFADLLKNWLFMKSFAVLKSYGEESSIFFSCKKNPSVSRAQTCMKISLESMREQWIRSCWFAEHSCFSVIEKIRRVDEMNRCLRTLEAENVITATEDLISYWEESRDLAEDFVEACKLVNFRVAFANILIENLKDVSADNEMLKKVMEASSKQRLKICDRAIQQRNKTLARKHTMRIEKTLELLGNTKASYVDLRRNFEYVTSRIKFMYGEVETNVENKTIYYIDSWKLMDCLMRNESVETTLRSRAKRHAFDVTVALYDLMLKNPGCLHQVRNVEFVGKVLAESPEQFQIALPQYSFQMLKDACRLGTGRDRAESYVKLADYCLQLLPETYDRQSQLTEELISSILNAMALGSVKAIRYFPNLLKYSVNSNSNSAAELLSKILNVPSWMFLPWKEQIISELVTPLKYFSFPIIQRLSHDYPNIIRESFKILYDTHPDLRYDYNIEKIHEILFEKSSTEKFYKAFDHLCQPEQFLKYHLTVTARALSSQDVFIKALDEMICKIYDKLEDGKMPMQGPLFKKILEKYRPSLLEHKTVDSFRFSLPKLFDDLDVHLRRRLQKDTSKECKQLQNYSTYLFNFSTEVLDIEIPNQYKRIAKPLPQYYPKIARIDSSVEIIRSKTRPVKIKIIGTDGKIYEYLVKFGRELQQDQRMQRVFQFSNEILHVSAECKSRHLSVNTYDVLPMSSCSGLVRWVSGTMTFKELVEYSLKDKSILKVLEKRYQEWIDAASNLQPCQRSEAHQAALVKYSGKDVNLKMKELVAGIDCDCLRKTFVKISPSFDCFFRLRRNFLTSYATMCLVHWIVGVGDRHLENTLVELDTGKCFGIDFTTIFGAGIDRPIPELVPFRLTPQILGFFKPYPMHLEDNAFGATMCHALNALKQEKNVVLTCLSVIVRQSTGNKDRDEGVKLLPKKKIASIEKKLSGVKPSDVMVDELSYTMGNHEAEENQSFILYKHIINGSELYCSSARSSVKNDLTSEKQVFCLINQATDMNLLGRMPANWCPFV